MMSNEKYTFFDRLHRRLMMYARALSAGSSEYIGIATASSSHIDNLRRLEQENGFLGSGFWIYGINDVCDGRKQYSNLEVSQIQKINELNKHVKYNLLWLAAIRFDKDFFYLSLFCIDTTRHRINSNLKERFPIGIIESANLRVRERRYFVDIHTNIFELPISFEIDPLGNPEHEGPRIIKSILELVEGIKKREEHVAPDQNGNAPIQMTFFVDPTRLNQLRSVNHPEFDLVKLIRICEELNIAWSNGAYFSVGMLLRTAIDHIPPIFGKTNFDEFSGAHGTKSFQESMNFLGKSMKKIADSFLHRQISRRVPIPSAVQVNFSANFDQLLDEICLHLS